MTQEKQPVTRDDYLEWKARLSSDLQNIFTGLEEHIEDHRKINLEYFPTFMHPVINHWIELRLKKIYDLSRTVFLDSDE